MPEPLTPARLAEIRDLNVDSCSADAPYNPDVWELEKARTDLLAEVERLRTPPPPGELRGLETLCAALHAAAETDPVVKEVAWRTFALISAHREQSAEMDRRLPIAEFERFLTHERDEHHPGSAWWQAVDMALNAFRARYAAEDRGGEVS